MRDMTARNRYGCNSKYPRDLISIQILIIPALSDGGAPRGRKLEDPGRNFSMRYETGSLSGASSRKITVKNSLCTPGIVPVNIRNICFFNEKVQADSIRVSIYMEVGRFPFVSVLLYYLRWN